MADTNTPEVHVQEDAPDLGLTLPGHIRARCADGIDAVEIRFRYDGTRGPGRSLLFLAKACLEVLVAARRADGTHVPAQVASREAEGRRWNG